MPLVLLSSCHLIIISKWLFFPACLKASLSGLLLWPFSAVLVGRFLQLRMRKAGLTPWHTRGAPFETFISFRAGPPAPRPTIWLWCEVVAASLSQMQKSITKSNLRGWREPAEPLPAFHYLPVSQMRHLTRVSKTPGLEAKWAGQRDEVMMGGGGGTGAQRGWRGEQMAACQAGERNGREFYR